MHLSKLVQIQIKLINRQTITQRRLDLYTSCHIFITCSTNYSFFLCDLYCLFLIFPALSTSMVILVVRLQNILGFYFCPTCYLMDIYNVILPPRTSNFRILICLVNLLFFLYSLCNERNIIKNKINRT